jgi:hypothetical protein
VIGTFLFQVVLRDAAKLLVDERKEDLKRFLISGSPFAKESADWLRSEIGHARKSSATHASSQPNMLW